METNRKKKKLVLLMLVFLIPASLLFYMVLSGNSKDNTNTSGNQNAFNDKLPAANAKDNGKNKLEIYMQAQRDSEKLKEQENQDPYAKKWFDPTPSDETVTNNNPSLNLPTTKIPKWNKEDANEKKVNDRIDKLMEALNSGHTSNNLDPNYSIANNPILKNDEDIERLEKMLAGLQTSDTTGNPEMKQLESLLDKILDIQHPERIKGRLKDISQDVKKDTAKYTVSNTQSSNLSSEFFTDDLSRSENAFWGLSSPVTAAADNRAFLAVIHENQKIQDDAPVKLRLLQSVFIENTAIPKGEFIYGKCRISGGRVNVTIQEIAYNNRVFPVQLKVYDQTDGMEGINIQGDMTEQVSKDGMDQLIQQMQLNSMTSSVGVQAATSGIQTAKNLFSKKVKKVTINLKSGHVLLLKPVQL